MTTIAYKDRVLASDGQVSWGDRIDSYNLKKVRKINGCLVGGAGRLASVLQFFDWFQEWSDAQQVQGDAPHVKVFVPEGINDEDFIGLVIFADEIAFMYEGGKKSYQLEVNGYFAIGSGSDYALAAMDSGASAEEAVAVAIKRDVYTGGEIFTEELDPEPQELTREMAKEMDKEDLIKLIFGDDSIETEGQKVIIHAGNVIVTDQEEILFLSPETGEILEATSIDYFETDSKRVIKNLSREYFDTQVNALGADSKTFPNKASLFDFIINFVSEQYILEKQKVDDAK